MPRKASLVIDLPQFNVAEDKVRVNTRIQTALGQKDKVLKLLFLQKSLSVCGCVEGAWKSSPAAVLGTSLGRNIPTSFQREMPIHTLSKWLVLALVWFFFFVN